VGNAWRWAALIVAIVAIVALIAFARGEPEHGSPKAASASIAMYLA
jgi:anti-sigma-K factor RskA